MITIQRNMVVFFAVGVWFPCLPQAWALHGDATTH